MKFADFFRDSSPPVISFEVFPPKTDAALENLRRVLPELIALAPSYMTVTYGAMGSTRERTLEIASLIKHQYAMETACHLTCVGASRADIDRMLSDIRRRQIDNIVALRGDPPKGETQFVPPPDGYCHGNELVEHIRRSAARDGFAGFGVAVAGYPEKHLEAPDMATDIRNLKRKVDAGADLVITQLFYDNADFYRFVDVARGGGIRVPIVPGLLPIQSAKQIRKITSLCGAKIPAPLAADLAKAGDDDTAAEDVGVRQAIAQATALLRRGAPGIHFYVLNKSTHMVRIFHALRPIIEEVSAQRARQQTAEERSAR